MQRPPPESGQLRSLLRDLIGEPDTIVPIESGLNGQSFHVEAGGRRFAAKILHADSAALLGPAAQFELLRAIEDLAIAPAPVSYDEASRLLITEWIDDARPVTGDELRQAAAIERMAALLRKLHGSQHVLPAYAPLDYAERYVDAIGGSARLSERDRARRVELEELACDPVNGPRVVCHNDLLADNCFLSPVPMLIDFDYAVAGPPILDLVSLVEMNRFGDREVDILLTAYFGQAAGYREEFVRIRRLVRLLSHFWALAFADAGAAIVAQYRIDND